MSLRSKTFSGLGWSAFERFGQQGSQFIIGIFLARLLSPDDFGLLAMVVVFVAIGTTVTDAGFSQAVIQKKDLSNTDLSTAFYLNIAIGAAMSGLMVLLAPLVAHFYSNPQLVDILRFLSVAIFFKSLGQVHRSQLIRELRFQRTALATLPAKLIGGGIAIGLAFAGWGVWALVMNVLLVGGIEAIFFWFATGWRPTLTFSRQSLKAMVPFGSRLAAAGVLDSIFNNIYVLVIGRFFLPVEVGIYQRADAFKKMGSQSLNSIVSRVLFPTFSKLQSEPERMRRVFLKAFYVLALFFFPLMGILAGVANPMIEFLIGSQWLPSAPYLRLMCIAAALYPLNALNLNVIKSLGHSGKFLKVEIIKKCSVILALVITIPHGVTAIILGSVVCGWAALGINAYYTRILLDITYGDQARRLIAPVAVAVATFSCSSLLVTLCSEYIVLFQLLISLTGAMLVLGLSYYIVRNVIEEEVRWFAKKSRIAQIGYRVLYGMNYS